MSSTNEPVQHRMEKTNKVLEFANASRKVGFYTDVCIKVGSESFRAHRLILACYSLYFKTMFETEMKEKYSDIVEIESVDATALESLLNFIYTEKISINQQNVFDLLAASDYLQFDEAKQLCYDFLSSVLSVETCFKVLKTADLYQNDCLSNKVFLFINENFPQILFRNDIKLQPKKCLLDTLVNLNSDCVEERLVYEAIIGWVKHDEKREGDFAELFQHLNLRKFSTSFLAETVATETLVIENHSCLKLVTKSLAVRSKERVSNNSSKILSLGGEEARNKVFVVYSDNRKVYPALPQKVSYHCSLKLDNFVYCIGGRTSSSVTSSIDKVWRMKLYETNMKWEEVASMKIERSRFGAAVYKNGIVVTGGRNDNEEEDDQLCEFFDPSLDQWSDLPSMSQGRCDHALVTCNGCLYCLGGYNYKNRTAVTSVEMLCDLNGTWQHVQPMKTQRDEFAAVSFMDTIYAIGGRAYEYKSIKSVEKYDPKLNKWVYVSEMNIGRRMHSACVVQSKIYVVGGKNTKNKLVSEIECYDPLSGNWSIVGNTDEKLQGHSIVGMID